MIISYANSRTSKQWKSIDISWEKFLRKISKTIRTEETVEEYNKLPKPKRDEIKDVGGFVGGKLKDGIRRKGYVEHRSMLTLDMDYGRPGTWEDITLFFDFACAIYSTHKHTPEKPRLRLIIPLKREVSSDEYTALGRMVAKDIGMEQFDDTTYEPARLMYWPSTSKDGEFVFERQEGVLLDPDVILGRYKDWRDSSSWPVSSRQSSILKSSMTKQADPLLKGGFVGAFCTTYPIKEAIEKFLSHVYKPSLIEGRYDYIPADSTAGVILYDEKFAYSHHATDPACNTLCNSFDLVRIHKFGEQDHKESYKAMEKFCMEDEKVKAKLIKERIGTSKEEPPSKGEDWQLQLTMDKNGNIKNSLQNLVLILKNDKNLTGIAYNQHLDSIDVKGSLPWEQVKSGWNDSDMSSLKVYIDKVYGIWSPIKIKEALIAVAAARGFHPIKEYLESLPPWDGTKRIDTLLIEYLGGEDNKYTRAVIRKTLVAAVARVYNPGIKFDSVLILNGPQGIGKSTLFAKLASKWFSDSLTIGDMKDKSAAEKLQGFWILELGELAGIRKTDVETVKSFISRTDDKYRASYGINVENHPRQCIIVGTTNSESGFLRDITGNRRFWPVRVRGKSLHKSWDLKETDQIWAEALALYRKGEELFLKGDEAQLAVLEQTEAMETDDREGLVRDYLEKLLPENWDTMSLYDRRNFLNNNGFGTPLVGTMQRKLVCSMEVWCECFGKDPSNLRRSDSFEINGIMSKIENWKPYDKTKTGIKNFPIYNKQRAYMRVEQETNF